jgi:hypothetical protein
MLHLLVHAMPTLTGIGYPSSQKLVVISRFSDATQHTDCGVMIGILHGFEAPRNLFANPTSRIFLEVLTVEPYSQFGPIHCVT